MSDPPVQIELSVADALARAIALHRAGAFPAAESLYRAILAAQPDHFDALHLLGVIRYQQSRHAEAIDAITAALALDRDSAEARSNLALALQAQGRHAEALAQLERALALRPGYAEALNNRGTVLHMLARYPEALASFDAAIAAHPDYPEAFNNRGAVLRAQGRVAEALASFDRALAIRADYADAAQNRANALLVIGRHADALAGYDQVLARWPEHVGALRGRGSALLRLGRADAALAAQERVLAIRPGDAEAHNDSGIALDALGRHDEALARYDEALRARPDFADAISNRGNCLQALGRLDEAIACYDRALAIAPRFVEAIVNRAIALHACGRHDDALACCEQALAIRPDHADALANRGSSLYRLGRPLEALASYAAAQRAQPDHPEAHWHSGQVHLALGDFETGLREFEWRWRALSFTSPRPHFAQPRWRGEEEICDRTLLLHAEQGIGDTIQFVRYAALAVERGARVILEVQPELRALLARLDGVRVVARGEPLPAFDLHAPLLSLPLAFGTTLATIPAAVPYLDAPADRLAALRERLGPGATPRIGVVWAGNPDHRNDRSRSIALASFARLFDVSGCRFVALQRDLRAGDAAILAAHPEVVNAGAELGDFADTAALVVQLDLVIAVDTAVAHLTGALARPVWILLPRVPDWRWMFGRPDSPWYPTARLFRQSEGGDWSDVVEGVAAALTEWLTRRDPRTPASS